MKIIPEKDVLKIAAAAPDFSLTVFISVMYLTGARISEVCDLRANDLIRSDTAIRIRGLKGGRERFVPVPGSLFAMLDIYWKKYNRPLDAMTKVFPLSAQSWRKWVKFEFQKYQMKMTPHALRHSRATHLTNQGASAFLLQGFLGHKAIESTMQYAHYAVDAMRHYL